jgi:hypothetical protein
MLSCLPNPILKVLDSSRSNWACTIKHDHEMSTSDKSKPYIPLAGCASDGWSNEDEATATCFCGEIQLVFVSPV